MKKYYILLVLCGTAVVVVPTLRWLLPFADPMTPFQDLIAHADSIGKLKLLPEEDCWKERIAADQADEKEGYHSGFSYPGHRRRASSYSITNRNWRPDVSKYGPRLRACEEKWRPIIEQNVEIGERRRAALQDLRIAIESLPDNLDSATLCKLRSTVVARARLSAQEATAVFARGRANLQEKRR